MYAPTKDWTVLYQEDPEAVHQIAQDPSTAPVILVEIAQALVGSEAGRYALQNPNVSPRALIALAPLYPQAFFENPFLLLLLLENPNLFDDCICEELRAEPSATSFFLAHAFMSSNRGLKSLIALHPNTPQDILVQLSTDASPWVRRAVALHSMTPKPSREKLKLDPNIEVARAAQSYPAALENAGINLTCFARHSFAPEAVLEEHRRQLVAVLQYSTDCPCRYCDPNNPIYEILSEDNSMHPLDIGTRQELRKREPKTDPNKRKPSKV
jgi:hypothetical protein